jgi:hypothetical protein
MGLNQIDNLNQQKQQKAKETQTIIDVLSKYKNYNFEDVNQVLKGLLEKFQSDSINISIVAEVSSGKSTFLNALVFKDQVLESKVGETTAKLFHIKYDDSFTINNTKVNDMSDLKKEISNQNSQNLKNIESNQNIDLSQISSTITIPDENLKKGIELYDTPGFGTVNESTMQILLKEAISKSDAVILLLDISQGLKKNEKKFVKDFLDNITPNKRFIVLNKYDSVISEDDLILKSKEEIEEEITSVVKQVQSNLEELQEHKHEKIETFYLSAQKALIGKKLNDNEKLNASRFDTFEEPFWNRIVNAKSEVFEDNTKTLQKQIKIIKSQLNDNLKGYKDNKLSIESLINISNDIENKLQEVMTFQNQISNINSTISKETLSKIKENDKLLDANIEKSLRKNIKPYLNDIGFFSKLAFWKVKDKYQEAVKKGLDDVGDDLNNNLQEFFQTNLEFLKNKVKILN